MTATIAQSKSYLLRIEGVNLGSFVFDTRDLSTVRGGSLLLLKAVGDVEKHLTASEIIFKTLSRGASTGLFEVNTGKPVDLVRSIREKLAQGPYAHATFVVDVVAVGTHFHNDNESLFAANRWRQMQSATLSVPARLENEPTTPPTCDRDGLRPALKSKTGPKRDDGTVTYLSAATYARRVQGSTAKQDFYAEQTRTNTPLEFAQDFEHIATGTKPLDGKLAVFYADGNAFGKIMRRVCTNPVTLALWDHFIRSERTNFLKKFLEEEVAKKEVWRNAKAEVRFETLLWGGDELMFVMPASLGWRFAGLFFESLGGKKLIDARFPTVEEDAMHPYAGDGTRFTAVDTLTHTAALVFCQHHAPIDRIKRLAKDGLSEFAKGKNRERDQIVVLSLESFDHLGTSFEAAMTRRYREILLLDEMILHGDTTAKLATRIKEIALKVQALKKDEKSGFARSRLRALANAMVATSDPTKANRLANRDDAFKRWFRNTTAQDKEHLGALAGSLGSTDTAFWLQIEELWDYALS